MGSSHECFAGLTVCRVFLDCCRGSLSNHHVGGDFLLLHNVCWHCAPSTTHQLGGIVKKPQFLHLELVAGYPPLPFQLILY